MRDDGTRIIDAFLSVCKVVQQDFDNNGSIMTMYQRTSFEDLYKTIGELYHTLVCFNIPTQYLTIFIDYPVVKFKLDYKALKILYSVYGKEDEEEEDEE